MNKKEQEGQVILFLEQEIEELKDKYIMFLHDIYTDIEVVRRTKNTKELVSIQDKIKKFIKSI